MRQGAKMLKQNRNSGKRKSIAGRAIGATVLTGFCGIGVAAAQACILSDSTTWTTWEVLRVAIFVLCRQAVSAYLYQDAGVMCHLLQIGKGLWPLIWTLVGQA